MKKNLRAFVKFIIFENVFIEILRFDKLIMNINGNDVSSFNYFFVC